MWINGTLAINNGIQRKVLTAQLVRSLHRIIDRKISCNKKDLKSSLSYLSLCLWLVLLRQLNNYGTEQSGIIKFHMDMKGARSSLKVQQANPKNDCTFQPNYYPFNAASNAISLLKTPLHKNLTQSDINKITRLTHENLITLRKIGKVKQIGQTDVYWLYYQCVSGSLIQRARKGWVKSVTVQSLKKSLSLLFGYLSNFGVYAMYTAENMGVDQTGLVKVYLPAAQILQSANKPLNQALQESKSNIEQVCWIYQEACCQANLPPKLPLMKFNRQDGSRFSSDFKRFQNPANKDAMRKRGKTVHSQVKNLPKGRFAVQNKAKPAEKTLSRNDQKVEWSKADQNRVKHAQTQPNKQYDQYNKLSPETQKARKSPQNIISGLPSQSVDPRTVLQAQRSMKPQYESGNNKIRQRDNQNINSSSMQKIQQRNINCINIYHTNEYVAEKKVNHSFDIDSVDTYQVEMGEDCEMPTIIGAQRLRQTVLNSDKQWDILTQKDKQKNRVHESAGMKLFNRIIQKNQNLLQQQEDPPPRKKSHQYENRTANFISDARPPGWQSSTLQSGSSFYLEDRVQQALLRTKKLMSQLKGAKSFSLDR